MDYIYSCHEPSSSGISNIINCSDALRSRRARARAFRGLSAEARADLQMLMWTRHDCKQAI